jgi:hypothetical protein
MERFLTLKAQQFPAMAGNGIGDDEEASDYFECSDEGWHVDPSRG